MQRSNRNRPEGNPSEGVGFPNTFITPVKGNILSLALALIVVLGMTWRLPGPLPVRAAGAEHVVDVSAYSNTMISVYKDDYRVGGGATTPYSPGTLVFTGTGHCGLALYDGVTVTLRNLTLTPVNTFAIDIGYIAGDTTLVLKGSNTVRGGTSQENSPGIYLDQGTSLIITGDGSLDAYGSTGAAGIGGRPTDGFSDCGKLTIESGHVRAHGRGNAAGIGGGDGTGGDTGGQVIVNGGSLYAESENGYAIGARAGGSNAGSLIVNGGAVTLGNGGFGPAGSGTFGWTGGTVRMEGTDPPRIASATATSLSFQNGDSVTVKGAGLGEVRAARVDGAEVTGLLVVDDSTITFTTPPGMTGGETLTVFSPTRGTGSGVLDYSIPTPVNAVQGGTPQPDSGSSSDGGSTPDSRVVKTQLPSSAFRWDGDRTLTIDHDGITHLGLLSVQWDGQPLTRGTDYTVHQGSVIVRFDAAFIAAQAPGDHTVQVEFLNHIGETTVMVGGDSTPAGEVYDDLLVDNHNPNTGGYPTHGINNPNAGDGLDILLALLMGSIGAAVLVCVLKPQRYSKSAQDANK